jgi:hypothetical protein
MKIPIQITIIDLFDQWIKMRSMKLLHDYQFLLMKMIQLIIPTRIQGIYAFFLDQCNHTFNFSIKTRRQPILAYSTNRKNFSGVNINQSVLNTTATPINNKRKLGGCTPTNKLIKRE